MSRTGLISAAALTLSLLGCAAPQHEVDEKYYLISTNNTLPYWQEAHAGLGRAATQLGVKAEMAGPETYDPKAEREEFLATLKKKPTGILISASDAGILKPDIDAAIGQGVPIITIDSDAVDSKRLMFIGTDNYKAGVTGAKVVAAKLQGKGNVVIYTMPGQANLKDRLRGYTDTFAEHPQIKITEVIDVKGDKPLRRGPENFGGLQVFRSCPVKHRREPCFSRRAPVDLPALIEYDLNAGLDCF